MYVGNRPEAAPNVRNSYMPTKRSMNWRNRIAGGIAVALGFAVVAISVFDGRWDNHDTVKPVKALLGGLAFIILGSWYLIRGEKAESCRQKVIPRNQDSPEESANRTTARLDSKEIENHSSFQAECHKLEVELRKKAATMERESRL
jgi:hypothetical protein